jgi:hypothetical protein
MKKQVILLSTHILNEYILEQYRKLSRVADKYIDLFLLIEMDANEGSNLLEGIQYYPFNEEMLNQLNYEPVAETIIPGSNHFAVLLFYRSYPHYKYYWNIEYDVIFNGNWSLLFDHFTAIEFDFISSHLKEQPLCPNWYWWQSLHLKTLSIPLHLQIKSFNPIYRLSNNAIKELDRLLSEGNSGHHEVLIPTVLNYLGYQINDFGGLGKFTFPNHDNLFYLSVPEIFEQYYIGSSMRYRPCFSYERIKEKGYDNLLYHPVKK